MGSQVYCQTTINHGTLEGLEPFPTEILDGRMEDLSIDRQGFELQRIPSQVKDWQSQAEIELFHYDELTEWAKAYSGCDAVLFYPALIRSPETEANNEDFAPVQGAHSDYSENYFDMIRDASHPYRKLIKPSQDRAGVSDEQVANISRVRTLQVWRNTGSALMDYPLAFCDARSVPRRQLMPILVESYGGYETQFESFIVLAPTEQDHYKWYCFPQMEADEVVVFRAYDSDLVQQGETFWTPHCAFKDPHSDGVPRSSLEMRAICLYF